MWPNPRETADLVTFTEEILNGKLHFFWCSDMPELGFSMNWIFPCKDRNLFYMGKYGLEKNRVFAYLTQRFTVDLTFTMSSLYSFFLNTSAYLFLLTVYKNSFWVTCYDIQVMCNLRTVCSQFCFMKKKHNFYYFSKIYFSSQELLSAGMYMYLVNRIYLLKNSNIFNIPKSNI